MAIALFLHLLTVLIIFSHVCDGAVITSTAGREFVFCFTGDFPERLVLINTLQESAEVEGTLTIPGIGFTEEFSVSKTHDKVFNWQSLNVNVTLQPIFIIASDEIFVHAQNTNDPDMSDGFCPLPTSSLGTQYHLVSQVPGCQTAEIVVISLGDEQTDVILSNWPAGFEDPVNFTLGPYEQYYYKASGFGDFTGLKVDSTKPVAVLSGVDCGQVPMIGNTLIAKSCELLVEMIPDVDSYGRYFVLTSVYPRLSGFEYRVIASQDDTVFNISSSNDDSVVVTKSINAGEFYIGDSSQQREVIIIRSAKPVLVAQYAKNPEPSVGIADKVSEAFMLLVPSIDHWSGDVAFTTNDGGHADSRVSITSLCSDHEGLRIDGKPLHEISQGKTTSQSSIAHAAGTPDKAVDGNTDGNFQAKTCMHTDQEKDAWWKVNLDNEKCIGKVEIFNRVDCCKERIRGAILRIGNNEDHTQNAKCGEVTQEMIIADQKFDFNCNLQGQYISIAFEGTGVLHVCEVRAYAGNCDTEISLQGKTTSQSSILNSGGSPGKAVDGSTSGRLGDGSCTHTNEDNDAWWKVYLEDQQCVGKVEIFNRVDCCKERLRGAIVRIGNNEDHTMNAKCGEVTHAMVVANQKIEISCNLRGKYISIALPSTGTLNLCEVKAYTGNCDTEIFLQDKTTSQSSVKYAAGTPDKAVDGNTNGVFNERSCTHTNSEPDPWWKVNLGKPMCIDKVVIFNRDDSVGAQERLIGGNVRIGNNEDHTQNAKCDELVTQAMVDADQKIEIRCNLQGQYISIDIPRTEVLNVCEVKAYTETCDPDPVSYMYENMCTTQINLGRGQVRHSIEHVSGAKFNAFAYGTRWHYSYAYPLSYNVHVAYDEQDLPYLSQAPTVRLQGDDVLVTWESWGSNELDSGDGLVSEYRIEYRDIAKGTWISAGVQPSGNGITFTSYGYTVASLDPGRYEFGVRTVGFVDRLGPRSPVSVAVDILAMPTVIMETTIPPKMGISVHGSIGLDMTYLESLSDPRSTDYQQLQTDFIAELDLFFHTIYGVTSGIQTRVIGFSQGSVIVFYIITFTDVDPTVNEDRDEAQMLTATKDDVQRLLGDTVSDGYLGMLPIVHDSVQITNAYSVRIDGEAPAAPIPKGKLTTVAKNSLISTSSVVAFIGIVIVSCYCLYQWWKRETSPKPWYDLHHKKVRQRTSPNKKEEGRRAVLTYPNRKGEATRRTKNDTSGMHLSLTLPECEGQDVVTMDDVSGCQGEYEIVGMSAGGRGIRGTIQIIPRSSEFGNQRVAMASASHPTDSAPMPASSESSFDDSEYNPNDVDVRMTRLKVISDDGSDDRSSQTSSST